MDDTWWVGPKQLNEEQGVTVELPLGGSYLLKGPPGSGKTNLLLLRANYLSLGGKPNIQVLVFTRTLREFIAAGANQYQFPISKVTTCIKWQTEFLYQYGVPFSLNGDFESQRHQLADQMRILIEERSLSDIYDVILLDEAQDYLPEEIQIFSTLGKHLFAVADSRQKIYTGDDPFSALEEAVDEVRELRYHYRNGIKICQLADALAKDSSTYTPLTPTANYDEQARPSLVEHFACDSIEDEAQRIIARLSEQLKAYPGEILGVACPRAQEQDQLWEQIIQSPLANAAVRHGAGEHPSFSPETRVCVCTFHAMKGLEFRALHLAGCEYLKRFPLARNMAYTAVTRAKTSLSLYHSDSLHGFLEGALQSLEPEPELPTLEDTFGGQD